MSNSTVWVPSEIRENITFVQTMIDMAFKAAGLVTFAVGAYNYTEIVLAITRVARGHPRQNDQRLAEEGIRKGGTAAERAIDAAIEGLIRLDHNPEGERLRETLERARGPAGSK